MKKIIIPVLLLSVVLLSATRKEKHHGKFIENFKRSVPRYFTVNFRQTGNDDRYAFGVESQSEPGTRIALFKIDPEDPAGAGRGPEIISRDFTHFGTYAARLKVPDISKVQPDAGAVVGYFTYHVDSVPGLSEIDWEWLIADPEIIYIGTWTGQRGNLQKIGRTLNPAKGQVIDTYYKLTRDGERLNLDGLQNQPENIPVIEGYNASKQFYTYGFDWYPDRIRWWMIHPQTADTIVLWDYQGSQFGIPLNHSRYRMNFWHTDNWPVYGNPNSIQKPLERYELEIDWMSYKPFEQQ